MPQTGDTFNPWLWGTLTIVAAGALIGLTVYKRRKSDLSESGNKENSPKE